MVCEDLSLNWNDHPRALVGVFEKLFEEGTLVDCTIAAEGQYVKAHKVILSACSPYFEMLFTQESEKNPIIILKDVKFRELKAMIEFIYRGKVKIPEDRLQDFVDAAESLQIKGLGVDQTKNNSEKRRNEFENVGGKRDGTTPHKRIKNSSLNINEGSSHHLPPERLTVYENITRESHLSSKTDLSISTSSPTVSSLCVSDTPTCVNSTLTGQRNPVENLTQSNEVTEAESVIKTELQPVVGVFLPESDCLVDPKKEVCEEELIIDNNEEVEEPFAEHIRHEESVEQFSSFPLVEESSLGAEESYTLQQMDDSNTGDGDLNAEDFQDSNTAIDVDRNSYVRERNEEIGDDDDDIVEIIYNGPSNSSSTSLDRTNNESQLSVSQSFQKVRTKRRYYTDPSTTNNLSQERNGGSEFTSSEALPWNNSSIPDLCDKSCRYFCMYRISEEERKCLFDRYSSLDDVGKNKYLLSLMHPNGCKKMISDSERKRRRSVSYTYSVPVGDERRILCKSAIINMFHVSRTKLDALRDKLTHIFFTKSQQGL